MINYGEDNEVATHDNRVNEHNVVSADESIHYDPVSEPMVVSVDESIHDDSVREPIVVSAYEATHYNPEPNVVSVDYDIFDEEMRQKNSGGVQNIYEPDNIVDDNLEDGIEFSNNDFKSASTRDEADRDADTVDNSISDTSEDNDKKNKFGDISYRPRSLILYSPPIQRQKWDEKQILPRINWGDLFFDLFYVGATYNISYIIYDSPSRYGFLYSVGTFWPLAGIAFQRTTFDARFVIETDDLYHRLLEFFHMCLLSLAVVAIRPLCYMSHPSNDMSMFLFCLALTLERILILIKYIEVYFFGVGQHMIKPVAQREAFSTFLPIPFYIAGAVVAGTEYFGQNDHKDPYIILNSTYDSNSTYGYESNYTVDNATEFHHLLFRWLAEDKASYSSWDSVNHTPIYLMLFGYISSLVFYGINIICLFPKDGKHKEVSLPLNVGFTIHRHSEWIMLCLGESIFSLLIVDVPDENNDFFAAFYCSVLSVVFLHVLHFRSQPLHEDHHALRRNKDAGYLYFMLSHVYSYSLVTLGAAYTFILTDVNKEANDFDINEYDTNTTTDSYHRWLAEGIVYERHNNPVHYHNNRWLADSNDSNDCGVLRLTRDKYRHNVALTFCLSLATIFACLDVMTLCHLGIKTSQERCVCKRTKRYNIRGILLVVIRIAIVFFTATMAEWEQNVETLAIIGLLLTWVQLILRNLGAILLRGS